MRNFQVMTAFIGAALEIQLTAATGKFRDAHVTAGMVYPKKRMGRTYDYTYEMNINIDQYSPIAGFFVGDQKIRKSLTEFQNLRDEIDRGFTFFREPIFRQGLQKTRLQQERCKAMAKWLQGILYNFEHHRGDVPKALTEFIDPPKKRSLAQSVAMAARRLWRKK